MSCLRPETTERGLLSLHSLRTNSVTWPALLVCDTEFTESEKIECTNLKMISYLLVLIAIFVVFWIVGWQFYSFSTLKVCLSSFLHYFEWDVYCVFLLIAMSFFLWLSLRFSSLSLVFSVNVSRFVDFCFCFVFRYFSWLGFSGLGSIIWGLLSFWKIIQPLPFQICFQIHYLSHGISIIYKLDYLISTPQFLHAVFCLGWSYVFYSCFIEILSYNVV